MRYHFKPIKMAKVQRIEIQMLLMMWKKWNALTFLAVAYNGSVILENTSAHSLNVSNSNLRNLSKRNESVFTEIFVQECSKAPHL